MDFHSHLGKDGLLFSGGADRTIKVWDLRSDNRGENVVQTISAHGGSVTCVRLFSGSALISSSSDGTVKTWFPVEGRGRLLYPWYALGQSISLGGR
jgi:WD40 repeat protein